jgi:LacI family transcriptional regulator
LKTRRSHVVGLLTGSLENPFFAHMVSVCSKALEQGGYDVILATRRRDESSDLHLLESLLSRDLAGVIIWSETLTEVRERVQQSGIANVVVMGMDIPGYDSVAGMLEQGIEQALDHLYTQGYTRIGYFAPRSALNRLGDPREAVYRSQIAAHGHQPRIISYEGNAFDIAAARIAAEALADRMANAALEDRPDALFCFNDMNAFGAMMGMRRRGLRVPEDIALVGCDNIPLGMNLDVPLTTIDYPLEAMCEAAVQLLMKRISVSHTSPENPLLPHTEFLKTHLVVRESSPKIKT